MPDEFKTFIQYARDLKFEDRPDYSYLREIIRQICEKEHLTFNYNKYDWILKKEASHNEEQKEGNKGKNNENNQKEKNKNKNNENNNQKDKDQDSN